MRSLVAALAATLTLAGSAAAIPSDPTLLRWVNADWPQQDEWRRIGICETGLNWQHQTRDFQGGLGFHYTSWDGFRPRGFPSEAYWASPAQQMWVGEKIFRRYGLEPWGCGSRA